MQPRSDGGTGDAPAPGASPMLGRFKVLSFTHFLAGPSAVQMLADLGAEVIKVESPRGAYERHWAGAQAFLNGESVFFMLAGRNQRSLAIDLRSPQGKSVVRRLLQQVDVVVENFRPGVMDKLGFGFDETIALNPRVVYCSCSGYGATGPYADRPGQDLLVQAMSGFAWLQGRDVDPPSMVGTAIVDQHSAVLAALGVLAALLERESTGRGKRVDSNLLNAALDLQIEPFNYHLNGFPLFERSRTGIATRFHQAPYGIYATADGHVCLSLSPTDRLAAVFDDPGFLAWSRDDQFAKREEINARVAGHVAAKTTAAWCEAFERHALWFSPVNTYDDVERDPQVRWNGAVKTFEHPTAGTVRVLGHPVRYDGEAPPLRRIPPRIGEHSLEILRELGCSESEIDAMIAAGAVRADAGGPA
jgi:crotonobetainyl-CoA:carnitine CoA-transferase CaiB-like acyl-CoA transferase